MSSNGKNFAELSKLVESYCVDDGLPSATRSYLMQDQPSTSSNFTDRAGQNLNFVSDAYFNNGLAGGQDIWSEENMEMLEPIPNRPTELQQSSIAQWPLAFPSVANESFTSYGNDADTNYIPMPNETQSSMNGAGFDVSGLVSQTTHTNADSTTVSGSSCNGGSFKFTPAPQTAGPFVFETNPQQQSQPGQENRHILLNPVQYPAQTMTYEYRQLQPAVVATVSPKKPPMSFNSCRINCRDKFSVHDVQSMRACFRDLNSIVLRRRYLANLVIPETISIGQRRMRFKYSLDINGVKTVICRKHFTHSFGISYNVLSKFLRITYRRAYITLRANLYAHANSSGTCTTCNRRL